MSENLNNFKIFAGHPVPNKNGLEIQYLIEKVDKLEKNDLLIFLFQVVDLHFYHLSRRF